MEQTQQPFLPHENQSLCETSENFKLLSFALFRKKSSISGKILGEHNTYQMKTFFSVK